MTMFVFCQLGSHTLVKNVDENSSVEFLLDSLKVKLDSFYVIHNGHKVETNRLLEDGKTYHFVPRILGGKGGFGSMLRAIGAQIEKTTSREACRDLSGRRMRDVNNEKNLKDWLAKEADREKEREERRQEKLARRLAGPKHNFDDPEYNNQKSKVQKDLDDALQKGLKRANGKSENSPSSSGQGSSKKIKSSNKEWLGLDLDSDDLNSDSDTEANPGSPVSDSASKLELPKDESFHSSAKTGSFGGEVGSDRQAAAPEPDSSPVVKMEQEAGKVTTEPFETDHSRSPHRTDDPAVTIKQETISSDEPIDLEQVRTVDELVAMGLNRLKNALMSRGLKCGGTLEERASRLFSVKGMAPDEFPSSLQAKSRGGGKKSK